MFNVNTENGYIDMHRGDTGAFVIRFTGYTLTSSDRVLVTFKSQTGTEIKKEYHMPENNRIRIQLRNPETDYLDAGDYSWDARVIIDPVYDENGNVVEGTGQEAEIIDGGAVSTPKDPMTLHIRRTVGQV